MKARPRRPVGEGSPMKARDAIGMPVPPPWAARAATALRGLLERALGRTSVPFQLVFERMFGLVDNKTLFVAVDLGVPDLLAGGPRTAADLAAATGVDADALDRVLRYLVSRRFFARHTGGRYGNTAT